MLITDRADRTITIRLGVDDLIDWINSRVDGLQEVGWPPKITTFSGASDDPAERKTTDSIEFRFAAPVPEYEAAKVKKENADGE